MRKTLIILSLFLWSAFCQAATLTLDMPRAGKSINWTGVINTPAWAKTTASSFFGSVTMVAGMTNSGTSAMTAEGRGSFTFTSAGQTFTNPLTIDAPGGTITLQDAYSSSQGMTLTNGTFNANDFNTTVTSFSSNNSNTRTLTLGSGTFTLSSNAIIWNLSTPTNLTVNANTSTILSTNTSAKTWAGGGKTYNNLKFSGSGTAAITITGSNTFSKFEDIGSAAHSILFTNGTTQTIATWAVSGTSGNVITINSDTTATHALTKSGGGTVCADYLNIQHSVATPGSTWYAGTNSVDNQAVATAGSGWTFTACPSGVTGEEFIIIFD